jgi:hypothetical protein
VFNCFCAPAYEQNSPRDLSLFNHPRGPCIRLEPLTSEHHDEPRRRRGRRKVWELWFTSVPDPAHTGKYIDDALKGQRDGHMLPWAVRDLESNTIVGSTRYHDIVPPIDRVEIGYTWYGRWQRTHVNTTCKLLSVHPRLRDARLRGGRLAHRQLQLRVTESHRGRWVRTRTACCGITRRGATAPRATV